ncbi:MAG TPA: argininosuccinate lyase [Candidatus Nanoarchaeia archaeon]|nr:argininosuccinate lyase [Candidatus Nanoarchaeia archaeon]
MNMKLWKKGYDVDKAIERFTVGTDYALDQKLVPYDCKASLSHAKMLLKIGVLSKKELSSLQKGLEQILDLHAKGKFIITQEDEDCHTAIENHLIKSIGEAGKKIHTARSRNDQVLTALRLYEKHELKQILSLVANLRFAIASSMKKYGKITLPGYTHMQKAMPTTIENWFSAYDAALKDDESLLSHVLATIDKSPLGSGAGYGIPILKIDRAMTSKDMGFSGVMQISYAQNSRGKYEALIVDAISQITMDLNKIAADLMLFSMEGFSYFTLPKELCTGSSIMPQKKNPDVLELLRAKHAMVVGYSVQIKMISQGLISGYNRDLQLTKEPLFSAIDCVKDSLAISEHLFRKLIVNSEACKASLSKDLYATEEAYKLVKKGVAFRDAYREIGKRYS